MTKENRKKQFYERNKFLDIYAKSLSERQKFHKYSTDYYLTSIYLSNITKNPTMFSHG